MRLGMKLPATLASTTLYLKGSFNVVTVATLTGQPKHAASFALDLTLESALDVVRLLRILLVHGSAPKDQPALIAGLPLELALHHGRVSFCRLVEFSIRAERSEME